MKLVLTNKLTQACLLCHCTPMDETKEVRTPMPMFHAQGVDVNWGEDALICQLCAGVMADMLGRVPVEKYDRLFKASKRIKEDNARLKKQTTDLTERLDIILAGERAKKEAA